MESHPDQPADQDFLQGIDEQFERLMRNAPSNRRAWRTDEPSEPLIQEIADSALELSEEQREMVLRYIRSLREK